MKMVNNNTLEQIRNSHFNNIQRYISVWMIYTWMILRNKYNDQRNHIYELPMMSHLNCPLSDARPPLSNNREIREVAQSVPKTRKSDVS